MHKEIEEAREHMKTLDFDKFNWHDIRSVQVQLLETKEKLKKLLALFDRMQQEPVVEVENRDEKVFVNIDLGPSQPFKTCFLLVELRDAEHTLPYGRYRRELEGCNDAK